MSRLDQKILQFPAKEPLGAQDYQRSIISLAQALIKISSQPEEDKWPVLEELGGWFQERDLDFEILESGVRKRRNSGLGLLAEAGGSAPGRTICLTACLDTAPIGKSTSGWKYGPLSGAIDGGQLYGRGSADSKTAVAIFSHLFEKFKKNWGSRCGKLIFLADADEHNGRFGAIKEVVTRYKAIDFVFIGYPGNDAINIGSRGFYRSRIHVYGKAVHSGSGNRVGVNAISRACHLVRLLQMEDLSRFFDEEFGHSPKITVTEISGGGGYTNVPDRCRLSVDVRLTPKFQKFEAKQIIERAVKQLQVDMPFSVATRISKDGTQPAYEIPRSNDILSALKCEAEDVFRKSIDLKITGPSNVGNFLFDEGIYATSGFGVTYDNIHAENERVTLESISKVYSVYERVLSRLFPQNAL